MTDAGPAALEVGAELELEVGDIAGGGGCVAHAPDGRVVFVRHSLPGERVVATVTSTTSSFIRADATDVLRALSRPGDAALPLCRSGAVRWMRLPAHRPGRATPTQGVPRGRAAPAGGRRDPGSAGGRRSRRRGRARVAHPRPAGRRPDRPSRVPPASIARRWSSWTTAPSPASRSWRPAPSTINWSGVDELEIIVAPDTGESLIAVDVRRKAAPTFPPISARLVVNGRPQQRSGAVHTKVSGVTFRVSSGVFWQVHVGAAEALARAVRAALGAEPGDKVVDLYAGAGLFSVLVADDVGAEGSVQAVERDRRACADAEHNGHGRPAATGAARLDHAQPDRARHRPTRPGGARPRTRRGGQGGHGGARRACDHPPAGGLRLVRSLVVQPGPSGRCSMRTGPSPRCGPSTSSP